MNFANLQKMISEGDLSRDAFRYLLECRGECEWLDYKESLSLEHERSCVHSHMISWLSRIWAVTTSWPACGTIIWEQVGLSQPMPYGSKFLREQMIRATGVSLDVDIVTHSIEFAESRRSFALSMFAVARRGVSAAAQR